jgi:hypothetical protein
MAEYDNTNKGSLFGNNRKREGKKDPDLQGKLNINGEERWISGWFFTYEKEGEKKRWINLAIGDVVQAKREAPEAKKNGNKFDDMEDDLPF